MSTHNTHYATSGKKFASAFPVPDYFCTNEKTRQILVFRCHDDANSVFDVTISFLDGLYFFYFTFGLKPDNRIYYITSCSFVSLRNCFFAFRSTASALCWHVDDKPINNFMEVV